ncbi:MAG: carboxypeptidase regulatory-like domain-containing protein [Aridibacter famidurans]|nr:carboxypeptidase regulatory-like domain-containing protein [Aridibacter famidurans]
MIMKASIWIPLSCILLCFCIPASSKQAVEASGHSNNKLSYEDMEAVSRACVSGTVVDETGALIPGVRIVMRSLKDPSKEFETISDGNGEFDFGDVGEGKFEISFTSDGFDVKKESVTCSAKGEEVVLATRLMLNDTAILHPLVGPLVWQIVSSESGKIATDFTPIQILPIPRDPALDKKYRRP